MNKLKKKLGQFPIIVALIMSTGTLAASIFGSVLVSKSTANNELASVETQVSVVEERENNHYLEVKEKKDDMNKKLDQLLMKK